MVSKGLIASLPLRIEPAPVNCSHFDGRPGKAPRGGVFEGARRCRALSPISRRPLGLSGPENRKNQAAFDSTSQCELGS